MRWKIGGRDRKRLGDHAADRIDLLRSPQHWIEQEVVRGGYNKGPSVYSESNAQRRIAESECLLAIRCKVDYG